MKMKKAIAAALVIATMTTGAAFAMPHSHNRERFHERWEQPHHIDRHEMHRHARRAHVEHMKFVHKRHEVMRHGW